jgi:catechol 2,3-dioxygenase-like lactoylglutathione lyase family enzyme
MKRPSTFLEIIVRRFVVVGRHDVSRLPDYPVIPPFLGPTRVSRLPRRFLRKKSKISPRMRTRLSHAVAVLFLLCSLPSFAGVREIGPVGMTVNNLARELPFYTNTLPFELVSIAEASGAAQDSLLNLPGARLRVATLKLGEESLLLTEHVADKGRPIPPDSRSFDHWFQHIAIVVGDMDKAYAQLRTHKVKHVSTAPQTLPEWNRNAGGIKAFYFRDPEDHVLEIIWFPKGKGDPRWQMNSPKLFLGIDHTAIVVSDTDASLAFYKGQLGMRIAGESENYGVEQEHLNQVFGARLRITGLRAERGPGVEFLEYVSPPGGRPLPEDARSNDLVFWRTSMEADNLEEVALRLVQAGVKIVSMPDSLHRSHGLIVRDPDGHALELQEERSDASFSSRR